MTYRMSKWHQWNKIQTIDCLDIKTFAIHQNKRLKYQRHSQMVFCFSHHYVTMLKFRTKFYIKTNPKWLPRAVHAIVYGEAFVLWERKNNAQNAMNSRCMGTAHCTHWCHIHDGCGWCLVAPEGATATHAICTVRHYLSCITNASIVRIIPLVNLML